MNELPDEIAELLTKPMGFHRRHQPRVPVPMWARAVADVMSRVQLDDGARKARAASRLGLAAEANPIRELVV